MTTLLKYLKAIVKTISITAAAGALAVMAGGCHWEYDPTGEWNSGGGEIVGDWLITSASYDNGEIAYVSADKKFFYLFKSSGKVSYGGFKKVGDVWIEVGVDALYYTKDNSIYITFDGETRELAQYTISGNKLTLTYCSYDEYDKKNYCNELICTKSNIADVRRSCGTLYTADSKLYGHWRLQGGSGYILFDGSGMYFDGRSWRYINAEYGDVYYYTIGNKLYLVNEECEWDDDYYDQQCTIKETVELTYSISGSGNNRTLKINNDTWIFVPEDDYYSYSQAKSSQVNFKIRPSPPPPFGHLLGKR